MKQRLLSLMLFVLAFAGMANAQITDLGDIVNTKSYYISTYWYGSYTVNTAGNFSCQYARWWNWEVDDASANDDNCKIAILEVDDQLYLYAISAQKFVNPDLSLTSLPPVYTSDNALSIEASGDTYGPWYLAFGDKIVAGSASGANTQGVNTGNDAYASFSTITEAADFDPTDALAKFSAKQYTVTFNVMYNGTKVDSQSFTNVTGTEVTFNKTYAFTTISGTTTTTIGTENQTIDLTATVTGPSTEDSPVYYYVKSGDGKTYLKDEGDGNAMTWNSSKINVKAYKFAIIGNPFSGSMYLKSKSGNYAYSATPDDEYGSDSKIYSSSTNHTDYTATGAGTSGVTGAFGLRTTSNSYGEYIYAGNRVSTNFSYSSYWDAGSAPTTSNQVLQIEEAETEELSTLTWTVSIKGVPEGQTATVKYGRTSLSDGSTFEASADISASSFTPSAITGYTANTTVNVSTATVTVTYIADAAENKPSLPTGVVMVVGDKAATMTPATSAEDNDHWYVLTQIRGGESMAYNNGSSTLMRGATTETAASLNGLAPADNLKYLVRFFQATDGVYRIQFADGSYIQTSLVTGSYTSAGNYMFYNINGTEGHFGWNLTTDLGNTYGSIVDNNAAGGTLAFWETGEVTYTGGNNDWYIYNVTFEEAKPTLELAASATSVATGTEITLTATASNFDAEPTITYAYAKDGGESVAMTTNTFTPTEAGSYVFTATATGTAKGAEATVSATTTVNVMPSISYTLTDAAGNEYKGTYSAVWNGDDTEAPAFTGATGATIDKTFKEEEGVYTLTGTITFPFPVSSATVKNATAIQSQTGSSLWYADGDNQLIADNSDNYKATYETQNNYNWYIYPCFSNGAFTFKLYNIGAAMWVPSAASTSKSTATVLTSDESAAGQFPFLTVVTGNGFASDLTSRNYLCIESSGEGQYVYLRNMKTTSKNYGANMTFPDAVKIDPTGINGLNGSNGLNCSKDGKFIQNGRLVVVKNAKAYTANGQRVK